MREDSHYTLGNKLILIIPEESSCDYIRNRKFIQWQSTVLPISTIKSTVLPISTIKSTVIPISTITSHLKVYTVTVNSSTNINNHLSPQGLYSDSQQFYQYQQSPLTSLDIKIQHIMMKIQGHWTDRNTNVVWLNLLMGTHVPYKMSTSLLTFLI